MPTWIRWQISWEYSGIHSRYCKNETFRLSSHATINKPIYSRTSRPTHLQSNEDITYLLSLVFISLPTRSLLFIVHRINYKILFLSHKLKHRSSIRHKDIHPDTPSSSFLGVSLFRRLHICRWKGQEPKENPKNVHKEY